MRHPLAIAAAALLAVPGFAQAPPSPPAGCDTPESHQFDFWVGSWEVHPNGAEKIIAHSLVGPAGTRSYE